MILLILRKNAKNCLALINSFKKKFKMESHSPIQFLGPALNGR